MKRRNLCNFALTDAATPLNNAYQGGPFIFIMTHYYKQPLPVSEQLDILQSRGLFIPDIPYAEDQLGKIGYFRLANYWRPMEQDCTAHTFKPGSTFDNALRLYYFDKELRALIFTAVQSVEIALRTKIMHVAAMEYGAFWFMDENLWSNRQ